MMIERCWMFVLDASVDVDVDVEDETITAHH
jgi:hypothetical protein